ncbi:cytochrome ubiquinol oxidase subunit I [Shigella boydii]
MGDVQKTKLAAIEAEWKRISPAAFTLFGIPNQEEETNKLRLDPLRTGHHCNVFRIPRLSA